MRSRSGYAKVDPWNRCRIPAHTDTDHCWPTRWGRPLSTQEKYMSFVTTAPAAISAAATQLEGMGTSFATESSAAASSTTAISPAAADEVSILQSGVFSTYGQLYQTVSAQAQAIHQQFVNTLQQSSGTYQETEGANQAGAAANSLSNATSSGTSAAAQPAQGGLTGLINSLTSFLTTGPASSILNNNGFSVGLDEVGNFASGYSDTIGLGGGGLLTALAGPSTASADLGGLGSGLASDVGPAGAVGGAVGGAGALAESVPRRYWPRPARGRPSARCRCRPAGPAEPESRQRARPSRWRRKAGPPAHRPGECRPGLRAPWPACPRSPMVVAVARALGPRATASSPRSCPRFPSRSRNPDGQRRPI